jgi:hypothetical protein
MSNLIKDLVACGNKHCDHIATNEEISKLQKEYFKSLLTECFPIKNKKEKKNCITKQTKKSKHLKLNKKRSKCIDKNCNQKQILNSIIKSNHFKQNFKKKLNKKINKKLKSSKKFK